MSDPFEFDIENDELQVSLAGSASLGIQKNPDSTARMLSIAKKLNIPSSIIRHDDGTEAAVLVKRQEFTDLAKTSPKSAAFVAQDQDNAALIQDDLLTAAKIESLFSGRNKPQSTLGFGTEQDRKFAKKAQDQFIPPADFAGYIGRQFSAGQKGVELGRLDYARSAGDTTSATKQKADDLFKTVSEAGKERDNLSGKIFGGAAEFMGQQYARLSNSFYRGMQGAVAGAAAGAVLSAPTAGLAAPITVAGGALTGFSAGFGAGFAEDAFITESGHMYRKLDDVKGANGETIETGIKQAVSVGYGTLSALVETASFGVLTKPFKDAAGKAAIKAGLVQGAEAAVKQALVSPTRTKAVLGALATHQKAAFAESSEEAIQQALEITGTFAAKKLSAGTYSHDELEDIGGQIGGAFVDTYLAMLIPGSVGAGVQYRSNMQQVRQAEQNKNFVMALGEAAGESKLRQRLPEKFQELLGRIRAGGPVENVYTPAEQFKTYWQEKGVDPYRMADTLVEDGAKQLAEAEAAGGDLVIPIESFATNLAATEHYAPLSEHIRLSPGDATAFEAAQLADEQEQIITDLRASDGEAVTNRPTHLKVYDDIMGQLQGIGYDRKTAEQYATLAAVRAKQRAAVLGVDAFELYNESPLKIVRPLPDGVQRQSVDMGLDPLLDRLRAGDIPTDESIFGQSLLQFVREKGVNDDRGDLKSMEVDAERKPGQRNIIRPDGMPLDKLREAAVEAGYLNEGTTTADLLEAIDKELRGSPVYSNQTVDQQAFDTKLALDELKLHLDQVGLDYNQLSNEQIRRELYQGQGGELFQSLPEKIEIDGVERWTVNSKGQPIAQTEEGIRNFWAWFGGKSAPSEKSETSDVIQSAFFGSESDHAKAVIKSLVSGVGNLSYFRNSRAFVDQVFNGLDVETKRMILSKVGGIISNQPEVIDTVIKLIPVDVMDNLRGQKLAPEMFLHDTTMLKDLFTVNADGSVPLGSDVSSAIIRAVAFATAKTTPPISGDLAGRTEERSTTAQTDYGLFGDSASPATKENFGAFYPVIMDLETDTTSRTLNVNHNAPFDKVEFIIQGSGKVNKKKAQENIEKTTSKVVDKDGRPLVVYHGTDSKFNVFEKGIKTARAVMFDVREEESQGFFFSVNEVDASEYGKNLMPVYLKAEYPLVDPSTLVTSSRASAEELANAEKVWSDMEYILSAVVYEKETDGRKVIDTNSGISTLDVDPDGGWVSWALKDGYAEWDWLDNPEFVKRMEERGYDSARTVEPNDNSGFSWFVTNPTQIKSVSNSGAFDPQNPNILFQSAFKLPALDSLGQFETGKPVTFNFVHNTESATKIFGKPKKDSPYDRGFEPSGRYVIQVEDPKKLQLTDKMISGELTFVSPLVVEGKDWKKNLSVAFGKKRGKHLSKAVIAAGYDGIVTIQDGKSGKYVSEILDLTTFDEAKALYQTDRESPTPWLDHAKNTTEVQRTELQTALIKFFGKTRDHKEAGYVLPDGTMLDLSGRHYAEDHPTLRGQRSVDHRELFGENKNGFSLDDLLPDLSGTDAMAYIMAAAGAMRVDTASGVASSIGIPTPQQISVLGNALKGDYVSVSYVNPITGKIVDEAGIDSVNPLKIRRFYEQAKEKPDTFSYYQKQQIVKRGFFRPSLREIGLLKDADLSTFVHELGHSWLEELKADASRPDAPEQLKNDWATIAKWLGTTGDITREQHEQFARGGEAYVMEGKAPSVDLQGVFSRLKVWLTSIYRSLKGLNVQLNDDVRGVFDRLLASEDEIKAARQGQKLVELFATKEEAGMTEAEFKAYRKEAEAAHNQEVTALEQKLMKELKREQADWWKEARADMQTVVEEEAFNDPVFKAIRMLSTGKHFDGTDGLNIKLDKAQLVKTYGEPFLKKLPRGFGYLYATENGLHPDVAAELFGFTSGDEMLRMMIEAPNIKQYIQGETDIRMKELYGDMMLDGTIADEAQEAIHNDLRGQVLAAELKALKRKQRASAPAVKAAEANDKAARVEMKESIPSRESFQLAAAQIMADKKIGDISPATYLQAERRGASAVFKATAKKDYAAAAKAKQQQMLNYYLYREAVKAQGQLEAMFKVYDKLKKPDKNLAKTRDVDMVNAARAILARFGIDRGGDNAMSYLQVIQQMNPEAYQDLSVAIDMATVDAKPYKQLTMPEMEQVHAAVLNLWNLSRRSKQVEIEGKLLNRDEVAAELAAGLEEIGLSDTKGTKRALTNKDRLITGLMGVRASMTRMEAWVDALDNNKPDGLFRKYLYNPIIGSINSYRVEFNNVMLQYKELAQAVEPHMDSAAIDAPEIDYTFKDTAELLGALLHTGNISNMEKLIVGRNWGFIADDGGLDTTAWDAFIRRMWDEGRLKKEHYDFVQGVWDLMEAQKPGAQKAHHAMYGHYFSEISADAFDTPFGEYRGGYAPAMSDAELNQDQAARQEREALESTNNSFMFPSAGRGFTKSRVKYNKPLVLDLRLVPAHIDKVLRFTFIEPRVKDIGRVVMTPAFRDVLGQYNSEAAGQLIIPWLQRAARQTTETPGSNRMADSFWRTIRRNTGLQLMVGNISNTLQQFTGLFLSATKVKKTELAASTLRYAMHPMQLTQQARDKSEMMQTRTMQSAYDAIQQAEGMIMNPNLYEKVKDANLKHGYILQQITQHTVDVITWDAAYNQAVAEGADEKIAVRRADSAVRMTQGSFSAEDLSKLETGTPFLRAMTQFFGYFNMQANLLGSQAVGAVRENGWIEAMPKLMDLYAAFALASVVSGLIAYGFRGKGDDDDESLIWELLFKPQLQTAAAMVPVVGSGVNYMINKSDKNRYNDTMSVSPAVSMFMATLNVPVYAYQAAFTDTDLNNRMVVRDSLNALGMATGLPVGPLGRPLGYLAGMEEGRFEPKDNPDLVRGLIQGTASK